MAVATIALLAGGAVAAKVGGAGSPSAPTAPSSGRAASAPPPPRSAASGPAAPRSAAASTRASEEPAVRVTPFLLDMVKVPAASFVMGSDHDGKPERPAHRVTLSHAFYIDRTEVRAEAYAACVADKECTPNRVHSAEAVETAWGCNTDTDRPTHPANCVDRLQAERYCAYAQKRLPTEAEWEYAARGADGREFPWGNAPPTTCAVAVLTGMVGECGNRRGTWEVGTTAEGKSAFGALDMAGNVWEWVADGYEPYAADAASDGGVADPRPALAPGARGVLRGGSWDYAVASAKVTYRLPFASTSGNVSIGFRCARDAE
jgi:formylglycine-generating enzyme required for sulfatase activity